MRCFIQELLVPILCLWTELSQPGLWRYVQRMASERRGATYNSFGNGSAMRVSPVGFACREMEEVMDVAQKTAEPTHNHPEGIKGAQAVAVGIFLARQGKSKEEIRTFIEDTFSYDLHRTVEEIRPGYQFDVTCQGSVPESIVAFSDSHDVESAIRLAVSLGGDARYHGCYCRCIGSSLLKKFHLTLFTGPARS